MKKQWILAGALAVLSGLFSSCVDPYYANGYGSGGYPRNAAEAAVPIVVGAALVGALVSHNRNDRRDYRRSHYNYNNYGGAYSNCPPHYGW